MNVSEQQKEECLQEDVDDLFKRVKKAFEEYRHFSQEQVDKIFQAAAIAANKNRVPLALEARQETGMGVAEDKVIKNHFASEYIYNAYKNAKTCDVIYRDEDMGYETVAEPLGILAGIVPTTNPTSTVIFKSLVALKTRNAIIFSPHPRAKNCTIHAAKIVLEAAVKAGAPADIIAWISEPSIEASSKLMKTCDCILATGGPGMVTAAYSSGKPAIGVGPGNAPTIIDESADIKLAVSSIIHSKTFDNGMICASENSIIALDSIYEQVKEELLNRGAYFLKGNEVDKMRDTLLIHGSINAKIVGQKPSDIAKMAGFEIPEETKIIVGEIEKVDKSEAFAHEKLCPVLALYHASDFDDALNKADILLTDGGFGHTADLYVDEKNHPELIERFKKRLLACRLIINSPSSLGGIGDIYNFKLNPSLTLGCGSWGGNSISGQVGVENLLNYKSVAIRRENMLWFRTPEKLFFKPSCLSKALEELKTVYGKKRALIVTDKFLFESGMTDKIVKPLQELGIQTEIYSNVAPDPTLACAKEGVSLCNYYQPDVLIALGGGSPMDCAKIMWAMYEHPEVSFSDMAMDFLDIRKRIIEFKDFKKAMLVCVPTTAGTGSEVTPFAIITDEKDGTKYPITDYALMPTMAIVDADLMANIPQKLTAASGIDALTHSIEAYVSMLQSPFTDCMAKEAIVTIFKYLPICYKKGKEDMHAREEMAHAATLAGIAFANAFLGIDHSLGHKLGAYHHLPHGVCVSLMLDEVMRFNASEVPTKMGTFPQYEYPHTLHRYAEIADLLGITGKDDQTKLEKLIKKIDELKVEIGLPLTIKEAGVKEEDFLATLDEMSVAAFNDQCTGTNPRYPLISEMKEIYLKTYYGSSYKKTK
ncbi:MAG: bifunctional acetaldehyde-CoA/alcohol dehydrogenase [Candidatus Enterosoma sp.]|nr:bifunctional acetaldehyde-CoA/alcohol dehydrogenase [bacterium]MDY5866252.1 bifunctional acetaldehyde-CoA/alcohol dehydrogenase [Candidatus Enterosoma sp.]